MLHSFLGWSWTGFATKTLWDWLQLLFVPILLAIGGAWFTNRQTRESSRENKDNQRETALQAYLDNMSELLLHEKLHTSTGDDTEVEEARKIARIRTLTVLPRLDSARKRNVLQFLYEFGLVETMNGSGASHNPIVDLQSADFRGAYLTAISLPSADLRGANFEGANLSGANLSKANLSKANLRKVGLFYSNLNGANLSGANLAEADFTGFKYPKYLNDSSSGTIYTGFVYMMARILYAIGKITGFNAFTFMSDQSVYGLGRYTLGSKKGNEIASLITKVPDLRETDLTAASLDLADLRYVDFTGAHLKDASFFNTDLREATLKDADLKDANLAGANLKKANLSGANLEGANMTGMKQRGANVEGVKGVERNLGPSSTRYPLIPPMPEAKIKKLPPAKNKYHQFRRDELYAKSAFSVVSAVFFLLSGVGTFVGIWTQSRLWAVGAVTILFLLAYLLGYRKALTLLPLSATAIVSGMLVYGVTFLLASTHYNQAQTSILWFNTVRILELRHQLIAGTCIGAVFSLFGFYAFTSSRVDERWFEIMLYSGGIIFGIGGGFIAWFIVSSLGSIFNWGFGFGFGWNFNLFYGFFVTAIAGMGLIYLLYVWIKTRNA